MSLQRSDTPYNYDYWVFIFVNPEAGGGKAAKLIELGVRSMEILVPERVNVNFFHLFDLEDGCPRGMKELNWAVQNHPHISSQSLDSRDLKIFVLVAGGDGSLMWLVNHIYQYKINMDGIVIGIIPYGTGNDFAKSFGWQTYQGVDLMDRQLQKFKTVVAEWIHSTVECHDIWQIEVEIENEGKFTKIDSQTQKKTCLLNELGEPCKNKISLMMNYMSFGVDCKIGRAFDRHRKKNALINKIHYALQGFKAMFWPQIKVNSVLDTIVEEIDNEDSIICCTSPSDEAKAPILKNCSTLVLLNIDKYGSGNPIWTSSSKSGLLINDDVENESSIIKKIKDSALYTPSPGDYRVEFLSFPSVVSLGAEYVFKGQANKVYSGLGPFTLHFKKLHSEKVYFQIDGEFFQMTRPKFIKIQFHKQIKTLVRSSHRFTR